jgi:cell division protein FtsI (penicillin-binding protein 3)
VDVEQGKKYYHDRLMQDDKPWLEGTKLSLSEIIENSSNVGISKLINRHYGNKPLAFVRHLEDFRLHKKTGIEISGEETPVIKRPTDKDWSGTTLPWMSIGYVIELTPLQLLCFYNAIANNGELMKPYLVNSVRNYTETIKTYEPKSMGQILSRETAATLQHILGEVVNNGTARSIAIPEIPMAGKTGTSKIAKDKKGYQDKVYQASFAGFFPADNPQYSCIIFVHEPSAQGKQYYGSVVAAPIFKDIVQKFYVGQVNLHKITKANPDSLPPHIPLSYHGYQDDVQALYNEFNITTNQKQNTNWVIPTANKQSVQLSELKIINSLVPNVTGMGLRDAMYLLESHGLKVRFKGQGKVYKQYPTYGTPYQQGNIISLNLR